MHCTVYNNETNTVVGIDIKRSTRFRV